MKKTIDEIRDWLLENAVDDSGDLDLSGLDFSNFDGDVYINRMKVKKSLNQDFQDVGECLWQGYQNVGKEFYNHKLKDDEFWEDRGTHVIRRKKHKKITRKQLAEMGYELEED